MCYTKRDTGREKRDVIFVASTPLSGDGNSAPGGCSICSYELQRPKILSGDGNPQIAVIRAIVATLQRPKILSGGLDFQKLSGNASRFCCIQREKLLLY